MFSEVTVGSRPRVIQAGSGDLVVTGAGPEQAGDPQIALEIDGYEVSIIFFSMK